MIFRHDGCMNRAYSMRIRCRACSCFGASSSSGRGRYEVTDTRFENVIGFRISKGVGLVRCPVENSLVAPGAWSCYRDALHPWFAIRSPSCRWREATGGEDKRAVAADKTMLGPARFIATK